MILDFMKVPAHRSAAHTLGVKAEHIPDHPGRCAACCGCSIDVSENSRNFMKFLEYFLKIMKFCILDDIFSV